MSRRVAIVGGGLSGLSAAYDLMRAGIAFDLYEASECFGGMLRTSARDGFLIEHGADSWVTRKAAQQSPIEDLARELGLADEIVASPEISPSTSILRNGKLVPLPAGMRLFIPTDLEAAGASPLFSAETTQRLHHELAFSPATRSEQDDESIADFVERHFGRELLEIVAAPLLAGVYGGDARKLSARAVIPAIVALKEQYGSLIRGAQAEQRAHPSSSGLFRTFRRGMGSFIAALTASLPASSLHPRAAIASVATGAGGYRLSFRGGDCGAFTDVILAVQVPLAARLLGLDLPPIEYSSAATVAIAYDQEPPLPSGFGFLAAGSECTHVKAATFVHQKWRYRVPKGKALLRAFVGSPQLLRGSDDEMVAAARDDFQRILGIHCDPLFACVDRWPQSMPQYQVGHAHKISEIERAIAAFGAGIHLAGNSIYGVGMPDAVRSGRSAAAAILPQK